MNGIYLLRALVHLSVLVIILVMLLLLTGLSSGEPPAKEAQLIDEVTAIELSAEAVSGKALFKQNCGQCHHRNLVDPLVGPALSGAKDRWEDYGGEAALIKWVKNSKLLVDQQHPRAVALWNSWDKSEMPPFPNLSDDEIKEIFQYVEEMR